MSAPRRLSYPARGGETVEQRLFAEGYSKRLLVVLKQQPDGLMVAGERVRSTRILQEGELLTVTLPPDPPRMHCFPIEVPVLYRDEDLIVYNKPAGLVCHRSGSHRTDTLESAVPGILRVMNRLDKDTSGALVVACHQLAAAKLWRRIDKRYFAVVSGRMEGEGRICLPLAREAPYEPRQVPDPDGLPALTEYAALGYSTVLDATLLRCRLLTGRMHQIRAQCAAIGHPLLGDSLYGGDCRTFSRQALHCGEVSFLHPVTGAPLTVAAPLPQDLQTLFARGGFSQRV